MIPYFQTDELKEELNIEKATSNRMEADRLTFERQTRELQAKLEEVESVVKAKQGTRREMVWELRCFPAFDQTFKTSIFKTKCTFLLRTLFITQGRPEGGRNICRKKGMGDENKIGHRS